MNANKHSGETASNHALQTEVCAAISFRSVNANNQACFLACLEEEGAAIYRYLAEF